MDVLAAHVDGLVVVGGDGDGRGPVRFDARAPLSGTSSAGGVAAAPDDVGVYRIRDVPARLGVEAVEAHDRGPRRGGRSSWPLVRPAVEATKL